MTPDYRAQRRLLNEVLRERRSERHQDIRRRILERESTRDALQPLSCGASRSRLFDKEHE